MTTSEITAALGVIRAENDLNSKALLLAGLVSELFRQRGFEPVVVGGSAIEFYTDGAYMSGDTDQSAGPAGLSQAVKKRKRSCARSPA